MLAGSVAAVATGVVADRFAARMKCIVLAMYAAAALCFLWFALLGARILPPGGGAPALWQIYAAYIGGGMWLNGAIPLFFELSVEVTFPIGESTSAGAIMLLSNLVQVVYLFVPLASVGTAWMSWALAAVVPLCGALLVPCDLKYQRRAIDTRGDRGSSDAAAAGGGGFAPVAGAGAAGARQPRA